MQRYVWYVGYGSNLHEQRFSCYIIKKQTPTFGKKPSRGCTDPTLPEASKPITIAYPLYFALPEGRTRTAQWGYGGVAFIRPHREENTATLGRMWKITYEQYQEVREQEGAWYDQEIQLGEDDGIPILAITHAADFANILSPSASYLKTMAMGLQELYGLDSEKIVQYLSGKVGIKDTLSQDKLLRIVAWQEAQAQAIAARRAAHADKPEAPHAPALPQGNSTPVPGAGSPLEGSTMKTREEYLIEHEKRLLARLADLQKAADQYLAIVYGLAFLIILVAFGIVSEVSLAGNKVVFDRPAIYVFCTLIFLAIYSVMNYTLLQLKELSKALNNNSRALLACNPNALPIRANDFCLTVSGIVGLTVSLARPSFLLVGKVVYYGLVSSFFGFLKLYIWLLRRLRTTSGSSGQPSPQPKIISLFQHLYRFALRMGFIGVKSYAFLYGLFWTPIMFCLPIYILLFALLLPNGAVMRRDQGEMTGASSTVSPVSSVSPQPISIVLFSFSLPNSSVTSREDGAMTKAGGTVSPVSFISKTLLQVAEGLLIGLLLMTTCIGIILIFTALEDVRSAMEQVRQQDQTRLEAQLTTLAAFF